MKERHGESWSRQNSAEYAGFKDHQSVRQAVILVEALKTDPDLAKETVMKRAWARVDRKLQIVKDREAAGLRASIADSGLTATSGMEQEEQQDELQHQEEQLAYDGVAPSPPPKPKSIPQTASREGLFTIEQGDCFEWAKEYTGGIFDVVHLDPPYGINIGKAGMALTQGMDGYEDTEDLYWQALEFFLKEWDGVAPYAHALVWCDPRQVHATMGWLVDAGWEPCNRPLLWVKSDNAGTIPNPERDPRWTYETAILARRGNRRVSKCVASHYPCPTSKVIHPTEKPVAMLKHFFRLMEQPGSRLLDPMCGSGNSIQAWAKFKDVEGVGIELNAEWAEAGGQALRRALKLEAASGPKFVLGGNPDL